jgi:HAD superfamily hydrolase (TIGR01484 family)
MHFLALATDYDGTIAHDGLLEEATVVALERLRESGRHLIMVTGRELDELKTVCHRLDLFELVVAENGALLYTPATGEETLLCEPPSLDLVARLKAEGITEISVGRSIIATWEPHETVVLEAIRDLGLELQIIFNKGAVMVLPSTVNKATGLAAALERLKLDTDRVVGVGDAENDHAFIEACGCGVAVANAIPSLKERADIVMGLPRGEGVAELIDRMIATDLADIRSRRLARMAGLAVADGFDEERSFYFRGPQSALNLRAQSLPLFLQIADGVDDATWLFHLTAGDFERWFREVIGDERLAAAAEAAAAESGGDAAASRRRIAEAAQRLIRPQAQAAKGDDDDATSAAA